MLQVGDRPTDFERSVECEGCAEPSNDLALVPHRWGNKMVLTALCPSCRRVGGHC